MALTDQDKLDIKEGVYELYEELGSHTINFLTFDEVNNTLGSNDVYSEKKFKQYLDPITLIGKARIRNSEEMLKDTGGFIEYDTSFAFSLKELEDKSVLQLGENLILKSRLEYDSITYDIIRFTPMITLADTNFKYEMLGRRVY